MHQKLVRMVRNQLPNMEIYKVDMYSQSLNHFLDYPNKKMVSQVAYIIVNTLWIHQDRN